MFVFFEKKVKENLEVTEIVISLQPQLRQEQWQIINQHLRELDKTKQEDFVIDIITKLQELQ
ncbi:Uncharacterised protein [Bergeyella zoohelcum]|uniref:Uncharacterized protein n=1 Tax=Bergeyella zoohelcum TaxID=1015 RepID=A0A7Z9CFX0_9FLAO|nr:Uncharacterised protein [Bergeyella zoohelcum]